MVFFFRAVADLWFRYLVGFLSVPLPFGPLCTRSALARLSICQVLFRLLFCRRFRFAPRWLLCAPSSFSAPLCWPLFPSPAPSLFNATPSFVCFWVYAIVSAACFFSYYLIYFVGFHCGHARCCPCRCPLPNLIRIVLRLTLLPFIALSLLHGSSSFWVHLYLQFVMSFVPFSPLFSFIIIPSTDFWGISVMNLFSCLILVICPAP